MSVGEFEWWCVRSVLTERFGEIVLTKSHISIGRAHRITVQVTPIAYMSFQPLNQKTHKKRRYTR